MEARCLCANPSSCGTPPSGAWEARRPTSAGDQQPTGPPPAGQLTVLTGRQLTDVVETANASSNANKTFFPLAMSWRLYAGKQQLVTVSANNGGVLDVIGPRPQESKGRPDNQSDVGEVDLVPTASAWSGEHGGHRVTLALSQTVDLGEQVAKFGELAQRVLTRNPDLAACLGDT